MGVDSATRSTVASELLQRDCGDRIGHCSTLAEALRASKLS